MFSWFRERINWEKVTTLTLRVFNQAFIEIRADICDLKSRIEELEKVQKTLSDDMYDVQADLTLVHNIEGYEDWRKEIGKPVSKPTDIVK